MWDAPTRVSEIDAMTKAPRISGDASHDGKRKKKKEVETAPPLEECKPLEVNDETRWKAKVFNKDGEEIVDDSTEVILKKALLILNKLSLTKFEKLSDDFIATGIGKSEECLNGAIGLIINKAQDEQHFSAMYAGLCLKLARTTFDFEEGHSKKGKRFKKMLLEQCQKEFEQDTDTKIQTATKDIEDEEEREYHAALVKKHYLGHMRFIGELYKGDLISIKIMLWCLSSLLDGDVASTSGKSDEEKKGDKDDGDSDVDEEKVECFAKLMTTIGSSLEQQSEAMKSVGKSNAADSLADCWRTVEIMAGKRDEKGPHVSNRMKFMLQDLLDMKVNGELVFYSSKFVKNTKDFYLVVSYIIHVFLLWYFEIFNVSKVGQVEGKKKQPKPLHKFTKKQPKKRRALKGVHQVILFNGWLVQVVFEDREALVTFAICQSRTLSLLWTLTASCQYHRLDFLAVSQWVTLLVGTLPKRIDPQPKNQKQGDLIHLVEPLEPSMMSQ